MLAALLGQGSAAGRPKGGKCPGSRNELISAMWVVRVVRRAEHAVAVSVQLAAQRFHETRERGVVASARPGQVGIR